MCPASVWPIFVRLSPCRRKLLIETTRIEEEYEAAKRDYIEAPGVSHTILETLSRVESMQTREVRLLLEKELKMISQRACGLINQTVMKTFPDCGMSLEHMDVGDGAQSATSGMRGVSVTQYPGWSI